MADNGEILSDRNIAAFIARDNPEAQEAAEALSKLIADPVATWGVFMKLNITTELMLSILKSIATDPGASTSGRIAAIREMRAIARSAALSWQQLTRHYKLEEAVADEIMRKRLIVTPIPTPEEDAEARRVRALLDNVIDMRDEFPDYEDDDEEDEEEEQADGGLSQARNS